MKHSSQKKQQCALVKGYCKTWPKGLALALMFGILLASLAGCGRQKEDEGSRQVVLTTGFGKNEVFRIDSASCSLAEVMVYLTTTQNQYEGVYGDGIWQKDLDGVTLEENVKEIVLARLAQIKSMCLLAEEAGITLSEEEEGKVEAAAQAYFTSLNQAEIDGMGVTEEVIRKMYAEYAVANKVYQYMIRDVNPEISDDEARTITVEHILLKTYTLDENGNRLECSKETRAAQRQKMQEILQKARDGEDFEALITDYSEDETGTYSFGKGEMDPAFEEAAFNLGNGEISDVVDTAYGYHIIKCISTFNREETDANKIKIMEQRREEAFGQAYDAFVEKLPKALNEKLWDNVTFLTAEQVRTTDFFQVFDTYFGIS